MRKYIIALGLLLSAATYAQDIEVSGQFVVAPFVLADCAAEGLTEPTFGLKADNELLELLAFFADSTSNNVAGMDEVLLSNSDEPTSLTDIYSLDGRKLINLKRGVNIVVNENGLTRKIIVR